MRRTSLIALGVALLAAAAAPAQTTGGALVKTATSAKLGTKILVDGRGRTLYFYVSDTKSSSACINDATYHCSKVWPPLLTSGAPKAGVGIKASLLATLKRPDGSTQVTYGGHPLYTFKGGQGSGIAGDRKPGDVSGQGFLGFWWAVSPSGKKITKTP